VFSQRHSWKIAELALNSNHSCHISCMRCLIKENPVLNFLVHDLSLGFSVTRLTRRVSLVEQELVPSGAPEFTSDFQWGSCYSIFSLIFMVCWSLFVLLYFFFWSLCCLFLNFADIRILIAPLVSSNSSSKSTQYRM
jgi:hypothetical protein